MKREYTPEERALRSERMKALLASGRMKRKPKPDPALQEALAKVPMNMPQVVPSGVAAVPVAELPPNGAAAKAPVILVDVDWDHIPMLEGQAAYATLHEEFKKAGRILNARSMQRFETYTCFMCKKKCSGRPGYTDHSYIDPKTGLNILVQCCGELCLINFNKFRIDERLARHLQEAEAQRG